jgi:hypothetical protein
VTRTNREVSRIGAALCSVAALLSILAAFTGCNRRTQLVPADADSTGVVDSSAVLLRDVQSSWEAEASSEAAELTARAVSARIAGLPPAEWEERADLLLDSLAVGYESAAGDCGLLINLFSRSDPSAGSWPWLFTCDRLTPRAQPVEGKNLKLTNLVTRGLAPGVATNRPPGVAALFGRRAGAGHQPVLMVWSADPRDGSWDLAQTLGPDSLGGTGTGDFEAPADTVIELVTRTYRNPASFAECATCPHLYKIHRYRWGAKSFERMGPDSLVPSPYASFVAFVQSLAANDFERARRFASEDNVVDQARHLDWGGRRGAWRVAPGAGETPSQMVFFRGDQEAYRVFFTRRGDQWLITGFEETTRSLE